MRRWIASVLLLALLCGCASQDSTATTAPQTTQPEITQPVTTAPCPTDPSQTTAPATPEPEPMAWTSYDLDSEYLAVAGFSPQQVLLFRSGELVLWDLTAGEAACRAQISDLPLPDSGCIRINDQRVAYWSASINSVVFLNSQLERSGKLLLDEIPSGKPYLTPDGRVLYYCTPTGIRVLDFSTGICRSLKLQEGDWLGVDGTLFNGTALRCRLQQPDGSVRTLLISIDNGQTLYEGDLLSGAYDCGDLYCCLTQQEWIFGYMDQRPKNLLIENAIPIPQLAGALSFTQSDEACTLELYDLASGRRVSAYQTAMGKIDSLAVAEGGLWFLDGISLHRWNYSMTAVEDETDYTALRFTRDDPDAEGLAACQTRAEALEALYGIDILLYTDILAVQPEGYAFEYEHLPRVLDAGLDILEQALARLPQDFAKTCASWTGDRKLHIALARSITTPAEGTYSGISAMQYLIGTNACLVLALDAQLEGSFYHALYHAADTQILNNSHRFDQWSKLNPSGFRYDTDYLKNLNRDDSKYLDGAGRYFISTFSMSFPVEDRATLFEYAMLPGNEEYFTSSYMQSKLKQLSLGLKDAFGLTGSGYPWEQYLK